MAALNSRLLLVCALFFTCSAAAAPIPGLTNTGWSVTEGSVDTNYHFEVTKGTAINDTGYSYAGENVSPYWAQNDAFSKWLTPYKDANTSFDNGVSENGLYLWSLSFDLTGYDPTTAIFTARIMSDNSSIVSLNGHQIASVGETGYTSWASQFTVNSYFQQGMNTLKFAVTNYTGTPITNNPTGLRLEFISSDVAPIPEPETYVLMLLGLSFLGLIARKRYSA